MKKIMIPLFFALGVFGGLPFSASAQKDFSTQPLTVYQTNEEECPCGSDEEGCLPCPEDELDESEDD